MTIVVRRFLALLAFVAATANAGLAAATPSARLVYVREPGTETCPDETEFRRFVASRLGYDPFFPWATTTVVATLDRAGSSYRGEIVILDERSAVLGRRKLDGSSGDCVEVARTMGLAVSVALDDLDLGAKPALTPAAPPPPPPPTFPPPRVAPVAIDVPRADPAPSSSRVPIVVSAAVGPIVSLGVAPAPSVGITASLRVRRRWLSLILEGRADLPSAGTYLGGTVTTNVLGGLLGVCAHPFHGLYGCGIGFLASFAEQGKGYAPDGNAAALYFAAGARVGWEIPLGAKVFVDVRVDGMLTPTASKVEVEGVGVYPMKVETGSGGVALGTRF